MSDIKGSTRAKVVGVLICFYGFIMFVISIFVSDTFNLASIILMAISSITIIVGIGLINLNYYAWLTAIILSLLAVLSGGINLILLITNDQVVDSSNFASKLFWQVIILWLLYASRNACRHNKEESSSFIDTIKYNSPVLEATFSTVITIMIIKAYGLGAIFILGFPVLIIEFAIFYLIGQKIQEKLGWNKINIK